MNDEAARQTEAAAPRPWLLARRLVAITLGVACGAVFVAWLAVLL